MRRLTDEEMSSDSPSRVLVELVRVVPPLMESPLVKRRIFARVMGSERDRRLPRGCRAPEERIRPFAALVLPCAGSSPRRRPGRLRAEGGIPTGWKLREMTTADLGDRTGIVSCSGRFDRKR